MRKDGSDVDDNDRDNFKGQLPGAVEHLCGRALGVSFRIGHHGAYHQAVALVAQGMTLQRSSLAVLPLQYSLASGSVLDLRVSLLCLR